jgi:hypothetical protein
VVAHLVHIGLLEQLGAVGVVALDQQFAQFVAIFQKVQPGHRVSKI